MNSYWKKEEKSMCIMVGTYNDSLIHLKDERKLSYREYGDTNENTVLFFHGFGSSAGVIHPDPNILDANNIRFFAVNRPGYGASDLAANYSPEDFADTGVPSGKCGFTTVTTIH